MADVVSILKRGGIGVIPADTVYGLVGSALNKKTVERIYSVRKRNLKKPLIVLISSINDTKKFGVDLSYPQLRSLNRFWPGKITLILPLRRTDLSTWGYLHRGTGEIGFRLPRNKKMIEVIKKVGPLVAPSANIEGKPIARSIRQAKAYFGDKIDFYKAGKSGGEPSTVLRFTNKGFELVREGAVSSCRLRKQKLII